MWRSPSGILLHTEAETQYRQLKIITEGDGEELENLRAKKETDQRLRERQLEPEQEHEEIELRRRQEGWRLQQQQQEQK